MGLLFASKSPSVWDTELAFELLREQNPDLVRTGRRSNSIVSVENGTAETHRRPSLALENKEVVAEKSSEKTPEAFLAIMATYYSSSRVNFRADSDWWLLPSVTWSRI